MKCPSCGELQLPAEVCSSENCKADISKVKSVFSGLRFHDLRHHAITELAESQASDQTIMAIAGHVSQEMLQHYSHVRLEAKRRAVEVLSGESHEAGGYVTKHDTAEREKVKREESQSLSQTKEMVGERGFEPPTPWSRTRFKHLLKLVEF